MGVGRNDPCPCGSGKKYKKCCGKHLEPNKSVHNPGGVLEVMCLEEGLKESYTSIEMGKLPELADKIVNSPEDYIFIISPDDWKKWLQFHVKGMQLAQNVKNEDDLIQLFTNLQKDTDIGPHIFISYLSALSKVGKSRKIGSLTPAALGDCYAVFFCKEGQDSERAEEVRQYILNYRVEMSSKRSLS